ncbi:MAG: helix-turn-helix domain-containing protein [Candidatus Sedimenticola sp. 20ELBAFRAG]
MKKGSISASRNSSKADTRCSSQEVECQNCGLDPICSILDYAEEESGVPDGVLLRRRPVSRGETIFRKEDPFHSLFAVKSGSFKTYVPRFDHTDQVVGFHLAGEMLGCEGMASEVYPYTARALENSSVCELRLEKLTGAGRPVEALQKGIIELLGKEVAFSHELIASMVHQTSEQRVAGFLLSISSRLDRRAMPSSEFNMGMSRSDIGNFLGLAGETVSRVLTKFQKQGMIRLKHKRVTILDGAAVQHLADGLD